MIHLGYQISMKIGTKTHYSIKNMKNKYCYGKRHFKISLATATLSIFHLKINLIYVQ